MNYGTSILNNKQHISDDVFTIQECKEIIKIDSPSSFKKWVKKTKYKDIFVASNPVITSEYISLEYQIHKFKNKRKISFKKIIMMMLCSGQPHGGMYDYEMNKEIQILKNKQKEIKNNI
jgi:hypothetical protein